MKSFCSPVWLRGSLWYILPHLYLFCAVSMSSRAEDWMASAVRSLQKELQRLKGMVEDRNSGARDGKPWKLSRRYHRSAFPSQSWRISSTAPCLELWRSAFLSEFWSRSWMFSFRRLCERSRLLLRSTSAHAGRSSDVSRWKVGRIAPERRAVRTLAARRTYQTALGTFLKFVKERALPLVEEVEFDGVLVAYSNDCFVQGVPHHHGSQLLAAVMDRWPSFSRFGSRKLPRLSRFVKGSHLRAFDEHCRPCNTTHPSQSSSYGSVHPHFAGNLHASVRASGIEKERSCLTACATSPVLVVVAASETGV